MAREFARWNMAAHKDPDWRDLPWPAQWLYKTLWDHPGLSYCGVLDWRPARLAVAHNGMDVDLLLTLAQCLDARKFVVIDHETEELLIRSWARFDGLMKQPRMAVSFARAFAAVESKEVSGVIVYEAQKIQRLEPGLEGWAHKEVSAVLARDVVNPHERDLPADPFAGGFHLGLGRVCPAFAPGLAQTQTGFAPGLPRVSYTPTPSPAPTPAPLLPTASIGTSAAPADAPADAGAGRTAKTSRGSRIPSPFPVTPEMVEWARKECPSLNHKTVTDAFVDYWTACPGARGVKLDWVATWRNWMRREATSGKTARPEGPTRGTGFWGRTS